VSIYDIFSIISNTSSVGYAQQFLNVESCRKRFYVDKTIAFAI